MEYVSQHEKMTEPKQMGGFFHEYFQLVCDEDHPNTKYFEFVLI